MTLRRCESSQLKRGEGYSETQKITVKLRWNHGKTHNPLCLVAHCWISAEFPSAFANGLCWFSSAGKFQKTLPNVLDGSVQEQLSKTWTAFELVKKTIKKRLTFWKLLELSYPKQPAYSLCNLYIQTEFWARWGHYKYKLIKTHHWNPTFWNKHSKHNKHNRFEHRSASSSRRPTVPQCPIDFFRALQLKRRQAKASEGLKELT